MCRKTQTATIILEELPPIAVPDAAPSFDPALVSQAAAMINQAKRPILYLGGGIICADAHRQALELAERAGLPTTMTLMALGRCRWNTCCRWACWACTRRAAPTSFCRRPIC